MKVYLAGPIFFYGDLLRNQEWAAKIRKAFPGIDLYSPVENTDINGVEGKKKFAGSKEIAMADNARLDDTDILIACIDGDVLPSGTSAEIGKFHEKIKRGDKKCLIGICTDNRQCYYTHSEAKDKGGAASLGEQQYSYQNLYVTGLIKEVGCLVYTIEEVIEAMRKFMNTPKTTVTAKTTLKKFSKDLEDDIIDNMYKGHTLFDYVENTNKVEKPKNITMSIYGTNLSVDFKDKKEIIYEIYGYQDNRFVGYQVTKELFERIRSILRKKIIFGFKITFSEKDIINEIQY